MTQQTGLRPDYLENLQTHVEADGRLSHQNGVDLLAEVMRLRKETMMEWPPLNDELSFILGMPNFQAGPFAHVYRAAGHAIPYKAEAEQAFVLHRFVWLWFNHGNEWRDAAEKDLREARDAAKNLASRPPDPPTTEPA